MSRTFIEAEFNGQAFFHDARFTGRARFDEAVFRHQARFDRVHFDVSPHATRVTDLAQDELDEVLATDQDRHNGLGYQVLGLVTACGGGLDRRDLQ